MIWRRGGKPPPRNFGTDFQVLIWQTEWWIILIRRHRFIACRGKFQVFQLSMSWLPVALWLNDMEKNDMTEMTKAEEIHRKCEGNQLQKNHPHPHLQNAPSNFPKTPSIFHPVNLWQKSTASHPVSDVGRWVDEVFIVTPSFHNCLVLLPVVTMQCDLKPHSWICYIGELRVYDNLSFMPGILKGNMIFVFSSFNSAQMLFIISLFNMLLPNCFFPREGPNLGGSFHNLGLSFRLVDFSSPGPCVSTNLRTLRPPSLARDLAQIRFSSWTPQL